MSGCKMCGYDPSAEILAEWNFIVPLTLPSPNERVVNEGQSRWRYAKLRDDCRLSVMAESRRLRIPRATGRRRVVLTRFYAGRQRAMDRGNWISACKPLLDALVLERLITGDQIDQVEDYYRQEKHEAMSAVGVRIQETR